MKAEARAQEAAVPGQVLAREGAEAQPVRVLREAEKHREKRAPRPESAPALVLREFQHQIAEVWPRLRALFRSHLSNFDQNYGQAVA